MIDPISLVIGFFFVTLLFLVCVGAFVYDMRRTLKGIQNELKKQNKYLRQGTATIITGDLAEGRVTTDPLAPVITQPPRQARGRTRGSSRVQSLGASEPIISGGAGLDMEATISMPRVER